MKKNKLFSIAFSSVLLMGGICSYYLTNNSENDKLTAADNLKSSTLSIRLDTSNLDVKKIQEEELHSLNDKFVSYLETIEGIEVATSAFFEYIAVSKDKENYDPMQKEKVYNVKMDGKDIGEQEVQSFNATNSLEVFNLKRFEKESTLIEGDYPQETNEKFEILITNDYKMQEQLTVGDSVVVFSQTINGLVKKEAIVSGVYESNEINGNAQYPVFYANFENTKQMTFFSDIVYDNLEVEVLEGKSVDEIIEKIKENSGIRPEILVFDRI